MTAPEYFFFFGYFLFSLIAIYFKYIESRLYFLFKPIPVLGLILFLLLKIYSSPFVDVSLNLIIAALFFGLMGDIFLLKKNLFIIGLAAFLVGHIFYIIVFFLPYNTNSWILLLFIFSIGIFYYNYFNRSYKKQGGQNELLLYIIFFYVIILVLMIFHSLHFALFSKWKPLQLWMFLLAPVFFGVSDSLIGWYYFIRKKNWMKVIISLFYYSAQGLFAYGANRLWL